jgi:hypothetical protein
MAEAAPKPYQRLPGTGYRRLVPTWAMLLLFFVIGIFILVLRGKRVQLWLGDDHLLIVDWDGAREYYKRIRYQDIQSIIVHRTTEGRVVNALLGGIILLFTIFGLTAGDTVGTIILLVIAAVFGLILLANYVSGPTCKCQLRTAVQTEELYSLRRLPNARKALDRLRPLITAAQGTLTSEEMMTRMNEPGFGGDTLASKQGQFSAASPAAALPPPPIPYRRKIHAILFFLLIMDLPCTTTIELVGGSALKLVGFLFIAALFAAAIMALVQQRNTNLPKLLKRIPPIVLVSVGSSLLISAGYSAFLGASGRLAELNTATAGHDPMSTTVMFVTTTLNVVLGVLGTIRLRHFLASAAPSSPPPIINTPVD